MFDDLPQKVSDLAPILNEAKLEVQAETVPMKIQSYVNSHGFKPTKEEKELQEIVDTMPYGIMAGSPEEANLLCLLLEMMNAKMVVEVGVFRGLSTLTFALCLAGMNKKYGEATRKVIGLDVSEEYAQVGIQKWKEAAVDHLIDFRVGDANDSLVKLLEEYGENTIDLCFIDADKVSYDNYYEQCLKLVKPGGLIVVDNTIWAGRVVIPDSVLEALAPKADAADETVARAGLKALDTLAIKRLNEKMYSDDRIERVSFLTIADGVTICRKKPEQCKEN